MSPDQSPHAPTTSGDSTGLWLVGARGAIATCIAYGLAGLREGWLEPVGLITESESFERLGLAPLASFVVGGHDVCRRTLAQSADELADAGVLRPELVAAASAWAAAIDARIAPGVLDGPDVGWADLDPRSAELSSLPPREQIAVLQDDWRAFGEKTGVARTVVAYLASTEAVRETAPEWASLAEFERALDAERPQPASVIYAYAALAAGLPFVNFTPNLGASIPALIELARDRGVPHCGNDGKTGETLVKTALAPMFRARALKVLSWQGYNMLGNRDGESLADESHKEAKLRNKDEALRQILGQSDMHTKVGIDLVPSLGDWKTAWDYVHFEGFLGARMSLQFTWQGSDSSLAAPLVIDLARLAELAQRRGEKGVMEHTACFFKAPLGGGTHDFFAQFGELVRYVGGA